MNYNTIGVVGARALATTLLTNTTLTLIKLSNNYIGDAGAQVLATALVTNTTPATTLVLLVQNILPRPCLPTPH